MAPPRRQRSFWLNLFPRMRSWFASWRDIWIGNTIIVVDAGGERWHRRTARRIAQVVRRVVAKARGQSSSRGLAPPGR